LFAGKLIASKPKNHLSFFFFGRDNTKFKMAFYTCFMKTTMNGMLQTFIILIFSMQAFLNEFINGSLVY